MVFLTCITTTRTTRTTTTTTGPKHANSQTSCTATPSPLDPAHTVEFETADSDSGTFNDDTI
jgi:hypothetical protein